MSDNKKYYYLKLKDTHFDDEKIIVLESLPDGILYSNIYLKLCLKSVKREGKLMFNDRIPYNSQILAQVTRHPVGVVEKAIQILQEFDLIEVLDNGVIYINDIQNYIGTSSTEADRKREYRNRIESEKVNLLENGQMSDICPDICPDKSPPEKEIKKDKELEIDTDKQSLCDDVKDMFNSIAVDLPKVRGISEARKKAINARVKEHGIDLVRDAFVIAQESEFLTGKNNDGWKASFDWIMNPNNFIKVIEGNYNNNEKTKKEDAIFKMIKGEINEQRRNSEVNRDDQRCLPVADEWPF